MIHDDLDDATEDLVGGHCEEVDQGQELLGPSVL